MPLRVHAHAAQCATAGRIAGGGTGAVPRLPSISALMRLRTAFQAPVGVLASIISRGRSAAAMRKVGAGQKQPPAPRMVHVCRHSWSSSTCAVTHRGTPSAATTLHSERPGSVDGQLSVWTARRGRESSCRHVMMFQFAPQLPGSGFNPEMLRHSSPELGKNHEGRPRPYGPPRGVWSRQGVRRTEERNTVWLV